MEFSYLLTRIYPVREESSSTWLIRSRVSRSAPL